MAWASTAPAAIAALLAAIEASDDMAGVTPNDGPIPDGSKALQAIAIGDSRNDSGVPAVEDVMERQGMGVDRSREQYEINCCIKVLNGSAKETESVRTRAYTILGVLGGILAGDPTLGGAVMSAQIISASLRYVQNERGIQANIEFAVRCDAFSQL